MKRQWWCAALLAALCCGPVAAGFVEWSNPSGETDYFYWENGGSVSGLYGCPTLIGQTTFVFFPTDFRAQASDGETVSVSDTLSFDLVMKDLNCLAGIRVREIGDFGMAGSGTSVSATGQLDITSLSGGGSASTTLLMTPEVPITSGSGSWQADGHLTGLFCNTLTITLSNELIAVSSAGSSAFIEKKSSAQAIAIEIIPEPATVALLGLGAVGLLRKRR